MRKGHLCLVHQFLFNWCCAPSTGWKVNIWKKMEKRISMFWGFSSFFLVSHLIKAKFVSNSWFATLFCLKWSLKLKVIQSLLRNNRCFQIGPQMEQNINYIIKTDKLGIIGPISWTHAIQNISKNLNLYPQQSQITFFTLPWDTL